MVKKVSKKSTTKKEETVEKVDAVKVEEDDEPSWYHYVIVLLIIAGIILIPYVGYLFYDSFHSESVNSINNSNSSGLILTKYPYVKGNATYNLYFHSSISQIEDMNFPVEVDKLDLLNTHSFIMAFGNYTGTDNGEVSKSSTMLVSFLQTVYRFNFDNESFVRSNQINCSNSTFTNKVIIFNPYSDKEGVFYNRTNGCIELETNQPTHMINLVDKLIYGVVTSE